MSTDTPTPDEQAWAEAVQVYAEMLGGDTPTPERERLSPETRAALDRGLAQSAAGEVVDLGTFSTPERETLTEGAGS